jgi:poly(A)-specific ribonuclease
LPDTLDGFCTAIHELFPRIIDTKYLATCQGGDLHASPTLQEIAEGLESQELPDIVTHADYSKYHMTQAFHEAGYDSLLTATIFLRLAAKLGVDSQTTDIQEAISEASFKTAVDNFHELVIDGREHVQEPVSLPPMEKSPASGSAKNRKRRKNKGNQGTTKTGDARFASLNKFDSLVPGESTSSEESAPGDWLDPSTSQNAPHPIEARQRQPMELIPPFDDTKFWSTFGNRLRVFGTQETMLEIAPWGTDM